MIYFQSFQYNSTYDFLNFMSFWNRYACMCVFVCLYVYVCMYACIWIHKPSSKNQTQTYHDANGPRGFSVPYRLGLLVT